MMSKNLKIALIHDELIRRGGAEYVFEELIKTFPVSDIYALYSSNNPQIKANNTTYPIHTSFLQKFPLWFRRHPGRMLPFLPQAAEQFDFSQYSVVISSASGFAKGIVTRSGVPHICYCHTPTRYLWDSSFEANKHVSFLVRPLFTIFQHYLRMADFAAAQRPNRYIANSKYTQRRITAYYQRESDVVYPPIDTTFFTPGSTPKRNFKRAPFVIVARLSRAKHIDHAISVCEKLELPLRIIGTGQETKRLRKLADKHTTFLGKVSPEDLRDELRSARALLQPGIEDFGIATAESLACGTPVIAYNDGGVQEIVVNGKHGILYDLHTGEGLAEAIRLFMLKEHAFMPEVLQYQILRFSAGRFRQEMEKIVENVLRERNT